VSQNGVATSGLPRGGLNSDAPLPIAVLISGKGTNLEAILQRIDIGQLDAEVKLVASNRPKAEGLEFARQRNIPVLTFPRAQYADRDAQQAAMKAKLVELGVELVVLAGFDQILSDHFVESFSYRLINLHPSLLPAFGGGMHAVRDALEHGVKITGCTVHFIAADFPDCDTGPIISQAAIPVLDDDDEESLLARLHALEHRLLPDAIQLLAHGRIRLNGRRVQILEPAPI
jgi:phosphoribosylglycinamide formyltransferase-1